MRAAITALGLLWSLTVNAPELPLVDPLLVLTICEYETRGEADRDRAVGNGGELGFCQVKVQSARLAGYHQPFPRYAIRQENLKAARLVLERCAWKALKKWGHIPTLALVRGYNGGCEGGLYRFLPTDPSARTYVKNILADYAERSRLQQWKGDRNGTSRLR